MPILSCRPCGLGCPYGEVEGRWRLRQHLFEASIVLHQGGCVVRHNYVQYNIKVINTAHVISLAKVRSIPPCYMLLELGEGFQGGARTIAPRLLLMLVKNAMAGSSRGLALMM